MAATTSPSPALGTKLGRFRVSSGRASTPRPPRDLVYGVSGVGLSTLGADYPAPIFVGEEGSLELDVARFDPPESWGELLAILEALRLEEHDRKTVVLDRLETAEVLIHREIARAHGVRTIEEVGQYKKGHLEALGYWHELAQRLERLARERGMGAVLLSRAAPKTFKPRGAEQYEGCVLGIEEKASTFLRGWAHAVLFAEADEAGARWLYTTARPGAEARTRDALPRRLELSFAELDRLRRRLRADLAADLRAEGERLAEGLSVAATRELALEALAVAATRDPDEVRRVVSRIRTRLAEQLEAEIAGRPRDARNETSGAGEAGPARSSTLPREGNGQEIADRPGDVYPVALCSSAPEATAAPRGELVVFPAAIPSADYETIEGVVALEDGTLAAALVDVPSSFTSSDTQHAPEGERAAPSSPAPCPEVEAPPESSSAGTAPAREAVDEDYVDRLTALVEREVEDERLLEEAEGEALKDLDEDAVLERIREAFDTSNESPEVLDALRVEPHGDPPAEAEPAPSDAPTLAASDPERAEVAAAVPGRSGEEASSPSPEPSRVEATAPPTPRKLSRAEEATAREEAIRAGLLAVAPGAIEGRQGW